MASSSSRDVSDVDTARVVAAEANHTVDKCMWRVITCNQASRDAVHNADYFNEVRSRLEHFIEQDTEELEALIVWQQKTIATNNPQNVSIANKTVSEKRASLEDLHTQLEEAKVEHDRASLKCSILESELETAEKSLLEAKEALEKAYIRLGRLLGPE